jgi:hypothetical protein
MKSRGSGRGVGGESGAAPGFPSVADPPSCEPLHVLLSAYACEPNRGSEPGVGWTWASQLPRCCRVSVITRTKNKPVIEAQLRREPIPNLRFYYVDLPKWLRFWKRGIVGAYLYYLIWQWLAFRAAQRLLRADPFALVHHVTFGSVAMPTFMPRLPVPFIFGPGGGGERGHRAFWRGGGFGAWAYEALRSARAATLRFDPLVQSTLRRSARIFVTTPETLTLVPPNQRPKAHVLPAMGIAASEVSVPGSSSPDEPGDASLLRCYAVARLVHWKGIDLAIKAMAALPSTSPARLTIVGDGPQRARLERLIARLGVGDRVRLHAAIPYADYQRLVAESDVCIFPSLHDSGGTVVLEAMAAGKAVICPTRADPGCT